MVACVLMVGLSLLGTDYAQVKITDKVPAQHSAGAE